MSNLIGAVRVALGAVILDTPDRTGCFVAKDSVGGWSYLVTDGEGDHRFRGDGTCAGGLDVALRWAVLAALAHVPDSRRIQLFVNSAQTHGAMLRVAQVDDLVIAAMGGRMLTMLVRPDDRAVRRAHGAAELAAIALLRERARSETLRRAHEAARQDEDPVLFDTILASGDSFEEWRERRGRAATQDTIGARPDGVVTARNLPAGNMLMNMVAPLVESLRDRLGEGRGQRRRKPEGNPAIKSWMQDLDAQINTVKSGLEGVGVS